MIQRSAYTIPEFCRQHGLSRSTYYYLRTKGLGPREMQIGYRTVRISAEAAEEWKRERELARASKF